MARKDSKNPIEVALLAPYNEVVEIMADFTDWVPKPMTKGIDGWWRYARKIHYTADIVLALSWGLICGFDNYLPYFYVTFFLGMILHRASRDDARCQKKYGADWDRYRAEVPYLFIPGLY